jgi:3',5'-cyclic AMP phosphodiesterase CpdA
MTTRLFHISDVHFGVEDHAALDAVARAVAEERPDAVVCTGDLTQRAKHSEYARAAEWFAALGVPVVLEPGNHDMPYYNPWERFTDPALQPAAQRGAGQLHIGRCGAGAAAHDGAGADPLSVVGRGDQACCAGRYSGAAGRAQGRSAHDHRHRAPPAARPA